MKNLLWGTCLERRKIWSVLDSNSNLQSELLIISSLFIVLVVESFYCHIKRHSFGIRYMLILINETEFRFLKKTKIVSRNNAMKSKLEQTTVKFSLKSWRFRKITQNFDELP